MYGRAGFAVQRWVGLLLLVSALSIAACDRNERSQAERSGDANPLTGDIAPSITVVSASSNVTEVAPKLGNGAIDGAEVYARTCAACHQLTGQGVPGAFPPLDGSPYVLSNNVERMASIMLYGLQGPIKVKGTTYNGVMLPQGKVLSDAELSAVAGYVRSSWSNKASGIEAAVFTKMREKYGEPTKQFTIQELGEEAE
ncbi:MAG: cytochrome c [Bdellovibrionota bacterium]